MSTYAPESVQPTDTMETAWFKAAQAFQALASVADNGTPQTSPADVNDDYTLNVLRAAHAVQQL